MMDWIPPGQEKDNIQSQFKEVRRCSVVRSCSCTLKGMVLGLEGRFVGCAYGANKNQHRNLIDLEVAQSLNQAFCRSIDFQHVLDEFFLCAVKR